MRATARGREPESKPCPWPSALLARTGDVIGDADTMDDVLLLAREAAPGRYWLLKFYLDRTTGDLRCWEWGTITRDRRGAVRLEIPPLED